jgi:hypothetical protein
MFRHDGVTPEVAATSNWSSSTRNRVTVEEMSTVEDELDVESSIEDSNTDVQEEETYMDCSLLRSCDRCTETEFSSIPECQIGTGRIATDEAPENELAGGDISTSSKNTPNNDRDTRSYQEYRKDDTYYSNHNNDNLAMIDSFSSSTITTPPPPFKYHYESCLHTKDEYEFNYIQFQVFICLLGIVSIYSIRKQKMFAASLFDQRRMKNTGATTGSTMTATASTRSTSRNNSRGIVIQRSNTGVMSQSNPSNSSTSNDGNNNVNGSSSIEMKSLLSSGSSNGDMDIV